MERCENFILFYSDFFIQKLKINPTWAVDETFSIVPYPFKQLYTIYFLIDGHVFLVVLGILKNKSEQTYDKFFEILKGLNDGLLPTSIKTDFEVASINSLRKHFPNSPISCCHFTLVKTF